MKASMETPLKFVTMLLMLVSYCASALGDDSGQPNVLFIAVDDLRPELGCYGEAAILSPNIDTLASTGVVFQRAYCQLAVCNPSRVSIMTGLRPDATQVWDLVTRFRQTIPEAVTLPQHFIQHGYHAVSYGKIFHNPWPDNQSWSEPHAWPNSSLWSAEAKAELAKFRQQMRADGHSESQVSRMRAVATEAVDTPEDKHIDGAIAAQTLAAMQRLAEQDKPFFLATGFVRPHLPFVVPQKYWDLYQADSIAPATNPLLPKNSPAFAMNTMYELRDYMDFFGTPTPQDGSLTQAEQRRLKHGYYASVSFIDALIGQLLQELERLELTDNTIVVLWGDHGWKLGEHNSWCKQSNYEIDVRVPLIIRAPGAAANGRKTKALVELVDVYPTLCELAGLPVSDHLAGRSIVPLLSKPDQPWKQAAFSQFRRTHDGTALMGYSMRTDRYRYIEWQDRRTQQVLATELYDHSNDPQENTNVAAEPGNKDTLVELNQQLWATLPKPPKYNPPEPRRPQVTFHNRGKVPLTLFWIRPDGEEKQLGVIQPGDETRRNTTLGHRFRIRGPDGFDKTFKISKRRQSFAIMPEATSTENRTGRPNIVCCMADDWSWPHAGILGDPVVQTPHFDRIAREGVLFENAFVSTPSCTPSRLSILTGQHHWRPACLPDNETVRSDVADYLWEVQRFDREVGEIVARLKSIGELENTIIVVSGDNGMPFPRCKATLYDQGTRVPLAVRWGAQVQGGRRVADFVSLCDLAPTFLEAAGVKPSEHMTGRSLIALLQSKRSGQIDPARTFALTGMEQHVYPYPCRALRTKDFLFIRNFNPDQWPTGEVDGQNPTYDFAAEPWPTETGAFSFNIDPSPSKQFLRLYRGNADTKEYARLAFLRHPPEELYDLRKDPDQIRNVASDSAYSAAIQKLRQQLSAELIKSADPRVAVDAKASALRP